MSESEIKVLQNQLLFYKAFFTETQSSKFIPAEIAEYLREKAETKCGFNFEGLQVACEIEPED